MPRLPLEYLHHIVDELDYLSQVREKYSKNDFSCDETLQRAAARSLDIIAEATKQLGITFTEQYPEVPWISLSRSFAIAEPRDKLIHHYFGIDYQIVWNVVDEEVPLLRKSIRAILAKVEPDSPF